MAEVVLLPWSEADLSLLEQLLGDPRMMAHLGGPEKPEQILQRHQRYLHPVGRGAGQMFKIVLGSVLEPVGSIGYWERMWRDELVYEMGWLVLPAYQGRGFATKAAEAMIALARLDRRNQALHAFPSKENVPSNAICRKLGFSLVEECDFEYPPGQFMMINDWRLLLW